MVQDWIDFGEKNLLRTWRVLRLHLELWIARDKDSS